MLQPGTIFDSRYELVRLIGRGGFAEVWLVKDTLTGLEEALKIYAPGSGMDEDGLKIFVKELIVAHDLHHPHLLTPNMLGQYERQPYLIMQYCPNGSLNKKVGECTEEEAWKILEHVASGLAYLHEQGVVHQDIKPDNILKDAKGNYVITDFGISLRAKTTLRKSMRVQANSGTMAYMAPERFSAEPHPMSANDIWSLGAMMFELIEGDVPFGEFGGGKQKNGADIPNMHAEVSDNLKQLICLLMDLDASHRPSAEELVGLVKAKSAPKCQQAAQPVAPASPVQPVTPVMQKPAALAPDNKMQIINAAPIQFKNLSVLQPIEKKEEKSAAKKSSKSIRWVVATVAAVLLIVSGIFLAPYVEAELLSAQGTDEWVDLGLPSETQWYGKNASGPSFYTFDEAKAKFGNSLPTKEQCEELVNKCTWTWNGNGYDVVGPNGNSIFLPAAGSSTGDGLLRSVGKRGYYWSSSSGGDHWDVAWSICATYSGRVDVRETPREYDRSVRLVKNGRDLSIKPASQTGGTGKVESNKPQKEPPKPSKTQENTNPKPDVRVEQL